MLILNSYPYKQSQTFFFLSLFSTFTFFGVEEICIKWGCLGFYIFFGTALLGLVALRCGVIRAGTGKARRVVSRHVCNCKCCLIRISFHVSYHAHVYLKFHDVLSLALPLSPWVGVVPFKRLCSLIRREYKPRQNTDTRIVSNLLGIECLCIIYNRLLFQFNKSFIFIHYFIFYLYFILHLICLEFMSELNGKLHRYYSTIAYMRNRYLLCMSVQFARFLRNCHIHLGI